MSEPVDIAAESLRQAITNAIVPLQTTRVLKLDQFAAMEKQARELTRLLKGHELVSKRLLNEFLVVVNLLRNEALFFKDDRGQLEQIADRIEYCLSLILGDKTFEEGGPRAI